MSLVAWYRLNDNAASTAVEDASGNGYHGTAARNTSLMAAVGKVGNALTFNGSSDQIILGDVAALEFSSASYFTVCAWVKVPNTNGEGYIIGKYDASVGWGVYWSGLWDQVFLMYGVGGQPHSSTVFSDTDWVHVAMVFSAGRIAWYRNGVAAGTNTGVSFSAPTTQQAKIGNRDGGTATGHFIAGTLDDIRIYNEALSVPQIAAIYNNGVGSSRPYPWNPRITRPTIQPTIQGVA